MLIPASTSPTKTEVLPPEGDPAERALGSVVIGDELLDAWSSREGAIAERPVLAFDARRALLLVRHDLALGIAHRHVAIDAVGFLLSPTDQGAVTTTIEFEPDVVPIPSLKPLGSRLAISLAAEPGLQRLDLLARGLPFALGAEDADPSEA